MICVLHSCLSCRRKWAYYMPTLRPDRRCVYCGSSDVEWREREG